jgi:hypothetical protein
VRSRSGGIRHAAISLDSCEGKELATRSTLTGEHLAAYVGG